MQLQSLNDFLNYQPYTSLNPQPLVDDIVQQAQKYLNEKQCARIQHAYEYAREAHTDQLRLSGEMYIVHPLKSTLILMQMKPDIATIETCILHDVIEDTPITYEEIKEEFGEEVAVLCQGLVKVSKVRYRGEDRQIETLKKTFLAMAEDLRVIFVKLVDRVHNIQTLQYHPKPEKRKRIADETMKIYVPIAKRLGLYHYQLYLENGCFAIMQPEECARVIDHMTKHYADRSYTQRGIKKIATILSKGGIEGFTVKGRTKSPYRVYQKLAGKYKTKDVSKVLDIIAFRVIVDSVGSCYRALGVIHHNYTPMIHKIKDYISLPKSNGYKSLHTTILGLFAFPIEIQIRTQPMDEIAEYGVAAHALYSEGSQHASLPDSHSRWIKRLQDVVKTYQDLDDKEGFKQELNIEVLNKTKFLYTPKGDVIELPSNGTVLDFAFRVHSDVGLRFKNAMVNGHIKPIGYVPATGDVVSIKTFRNKEVATSYWLDFLNTPSAKNKLQRYLKFKQKDVLIAQSKQRLNKKLKEWKLPLLGTAEDCILKYYTQESFESLLLQTVGKQKPYTTFFKEVYPKARRLMNTPLASKKTSGEIYDPQKSQNEVNMKTKQCIIDHDKILPYTLCDMCSPLSTAPAKIIARTGKDGIKIHNVTCTGVKTISLGRLLEAHRGENAMNCYDITISLTLFDQNTTLVRLISVFSDLHIAMDSISITNNKDTKLTKVVVTSEYKNPAKVAFLINELKKRKADLQVKKIVIE